MNSVFGNSLKYVLIFLLFIVLSGCGAHMVYIAPKPDKASIAKQNSTTNIPIIPLGEKPEKEYQVLGHVYTTYSKGTADTLPLNYQAPLPEETKVRLQEIASKVGADAIISATQTGFYGWIYVGQGVGGIAVKYRTEADNQDVQANTPEFIACVMPTTGDEGNKEIDSDMRIKARHFLIAKGYYVVTPELSMFQSDLSSLKNYDNQELHKLCGHDADFYVFIYQTKEELLSLSVFSKKEHKFIIDSGKGEDGKARSGAESFMAGGLLGMWGDSKSAGEKEMKDLIDLIPQLPVSCITPGARRITPVVECDPI